MRKEEGLARRPCRARTQECGHLQFEAMRVHTPAVLAVNNEYGYLLRGLHSLCKVQQEVIQLRDNFGGVRGHISCWRAVALNLSATFFLGERASTGELLQRCGGELRRDLQLLREKLHIGFDVVQVSRLQTQRITLEPKTKTYFPLTNLQIASLCSALRVSGNPMTGRDWTRVDFHVCCGSSYLLHTARTSTHCSSVTTKLIHT